MSSVDFHFEGNKITIQCNNYDKMKQIFQKFFVKVNAEPDTVIFLYDGNKITNKELTFNQLSNSDDKKRNKMNILVYNSFKRPSSEFIFINNYGIDESMKDYAKMAILLAFKEYPDDGMKRCELIQSKFEKKYEGGWICFMYIVDKGNFFGRFFNYQMVIKYNGYKIIIGRTSKEK